MELGDEVWVRHPTELWVRGTILRKQQAEWTLTIGLHNGEKKRVRIEGFVQTADVKLCNVAKDTSRVLAAVAAAGSPDAKRAAGAAGTAAEKVYAGHDVDDLISLTHLHEPAILHAPARCHYCARHVMAMAQLRTSRRAVYGVWSQVVMVWVPPSTANA